MLRRNIARCRIFGGLRSYGKREEYSYSYRSRSNYSTQKIIIFLETMYDFIWWYMGIIKEGVLTEAGSIIRTLTLCTVTGQNTTVHMFCTSNLAVNTPIYLFH